MISMNKVRRASLNSIRDQIVDLKDFLEELKQEEEGYRDCIPENLQGSERYDKAEEACDCLEYAVSQLEEAADNIGSAIE
jgi:predicted nuclease with TOPRIM domain